MSWFPSSFGKSSDPRANASVGDEKERFVDSHGVKEDLSQLTQAFTRQLWGVASFLAPPPDVKYSNYVNVDKEIRAQTENPTVLGQIASTGLAEDLVDVDFDSLLYENHDDQTATTGNREWSKERTDRSEPLNCSTSDHRLTGIGRDLAELKGSVVTGLSKFLRAVRDEIDRVESPNSFVNHASEDEKDDQTESFPRFSSNEQPEGFNTYFKPLFNNILQSGRGKPLENVVDESSANDDSEGERKACGNAEPSSLQKGFIFGFTGISECTASLIPDNPKTVVFEPGDICDGVGITEEVLTFSRNLAMHPETWLNFPSLPSHEIDDFETSAAQENYIQALEIACPRLAVLRTNLCPDCISEKKFWKIYFILVHSFLSKEAASLLSSPETTEMQGELLQELHDGKDCEPFKRTETGFSESCEFVPVTLSSETSYNGMKPPKNRPETAGLLIKVSKEIQNNDALMTTMKLGASNMEGAEAEADGWLNEESLPPQTHAAPLVMEDDDVSFSDLEDDVETTAKHIGRSNSAVSFEWIQVHQTSSGENVEGLQVQGVTHGDGTSGKVVPLSTASVCRKHVQSESDWSAVEEDDAVSSDSAAS